MTETGAPLPDLPEVLAAAPAGTAASAQAAAVAASVHRRIGREWTLRNDIAELLLSMFPPSHPGFERASCQAPNNIVRLVTAGEPDRAMEGARVEALRRGDEQAFAKLVDELSPGLLRLAMQHTPSRAVAEEVVQDTWIAVIDGIDRFEGRSSLRTWIYRILLNIARTRGRRARGTRPFSYFRRRAEEGGDEPGVEPERFQGGRGEEPGGWARPPIEWAAPEDRLATA